MTGPPMTSETRGRKHLATELLKDGYHERAERVAAGNEFMSDEPAVRACVAAVGGLSLADAFEMGCEWGRGLQGQTLEDSRAVGRTLYSDTLAPIVDAIDREIREHGFNSFEDADAGIFAAKVIIKAALALPSPVRQGEDGFKEGDPGVMDLRAPEVDKLLADLDQAIEEGAGHLALECARIVRLMRAEHRRLNAMALTLDTRSADAGMEVAAMEAEASDRFYREPTDWDYGAQDACTRIGRAIRALKSETPDPDFTGHIDCPDDEGGRG